MRIHANQLLTRILGTLIGAGFLAIGGYAMFGADDTVPAFVRERAWWFGAWCHPPRRPRDFKG